MKFDDAMRDPSGSFSCPGDVCDEPSLTLEQKVSILRQWEYDERELEVAEEENMAGGPPDRLDEVLAALDRLHAGVDLEHAPPTKQGGV